MQTDLRVRYTKDIIETTFLKLLQEKPLNRITVKELCEQAKINRSTFYKHYMDVYDLMEQLENRAFQNFEELLSKPQNMDTYSTVVAILRSLEIYRPLFKNLTSTDSGKPFRDKLHDYFLKNIISLSQTDTISKLYFLYIAGGTAAIMNEWIHDRVSMSAEDLAHHIDTMNQILFHQTKTL